MKHSTCTTVVVALIACVLSISPADAGAMTILSQARSVQAAADGGENTDYDNDISVDYSPFVTSAHHA